MEANGFSKTEIKNSEIERGSRRRGEQFQNINLSFSFLIIALNIDAPKLLLHHFTESKKT